MSPVFKTARSGEVVDWLYPSFEIQALRDEYPNIDVIQVLTTAADWTQGKPAHRLIQERYMKQWIKNVWLKKAAGIVHRQPLSLTPWQRQGITEVEYQAQQEERFRRKHLTQPDYRPLSDSSAAELAAVKAALANQILIDDLKGRVNE